MQNHLRKWLLQHRVDGVELLRAQLELEFNAFLGKHPSFLRDIFMQDLPNWLVNFGPVVVKKLVQGATALFDTLVPLDNLKDEQRTLVEESMAAFVRAHQDASGEAVATFHTEVMNAYNEYLEGLPEFFKKRLPSNAEAMWLADKYWSMLKDWLNKQVAGSTTELFKTLLPLDTLQDADRKPMEEAMTAFARARKDTAWEAVETFHGTVMNAYEEFRAQLSESHRSFFSPRDAEIMWLEENYWTMLKDWLNLQTSQVRVAGESKAAQRPPPSPQLAAAKRGGQEMMSGVTQSGVDISPMRQRRRRSSGHVSPMSEPVGDRWASISEMHESRSTLGTVQFEAHVISYESEHRMVNGTPVYSCIVVDKTGVMQLAAWRGAAAELRNRIGNSDGTPVLLHFRGCKLKDTPKPPFGAMMHTVVANESSTFEVIGQPTRESVGEFVTSGLGRLKAGMVTERFGGLREKPMPYIVNIRGVVRAMDSKAQSASGQTLSEIELQDARGTVTRLMALGDVVDDFQVGDEVVVWFAVAQKSRGTSTAGAIWVYNDAFVMQLRSNVAAKTVTEQINLFT